MPLLERLLTLRIRHCDEDLGGFAFELELDDLDTQAATSHSRDCTVHSAWTESEARSAYQRLVWLCSNVSSSVKLEFDTVVKNTLTPSADSRVSQTQLSQKSAANGVGYSPACVTHLFWSLNPAGQSEAPASESLSRLNMLAVLYM